MNPELRMLYVTTVKARCGSDRGTSDTVTHLRGYIVHLSNMLLKRKYKYFLHSGVYINMKVFQSNANCPLATDTWAT